MRFKLLGIIAIAIATSSSAQAQPIQYLFANSSGTFQDAFTIPAVGGTVAIQVFLRDTNAASNWFTGPNPAAPGTTMLNPNQTNNLDTYGLAGAGVRITSETLGVARVNATSGVTYNPDLDVLRFTSVDLAANTVNAQAQSFSVTGAPTNGSSRVLLGTFVFTGLSAGTTRLLFSDNDLNNQHTILSTFPTGQASWNGGTALDSLPPNNPGTYIPNLFFTPSPGSTQFQIATITVAPEPTSILLSCVAFAGCGLIRRYRRK